MSNIINLVPDDSETTEMQYEPQAELVELTDSILLDTRACLENKTVMTMPIAQLATLGAGVASLLPALRTVSQTTTIATDGLYRLVNAGVGDVLKTAQNGNNWGALRTATGKSKMAQFQAVGGVSSTTATTVPIDPVTIMMAVALFSIEQKLGSIAEMEKQILSFLAAEQEAEIEADIETLSAMITKYKYNWDNEHYVASNHKLVLDIQRTARKNMIAYQKQVTEVISAKKLFVSQTKVTETLKDLLRKFKYYRLTMYTFSLASFVEVMLNGDFKEENILLVKEEIEKLSTTYRDIFCECSIYLEHLSNSSLETGVMKSVGAASKVVGKFIDSIPKVRDGQVDEYLLEKGSRIQENAARIERKVVEAFAEISNPGVWVFVEKLDDMIQIYGRTEQICFDDKQIYLIAG